MTGSEKDTTLYYILFDLAYHMELMNNDSCEYFFKISSEVAGGMGNEFLKVRSQAEAARVQYQQGKMELAAASYSQTIRDIEAAMTREKKTEKLNRLKKMMGKSYYILGMISVHHAEHKQGLSYYKKAMDAFSSINEIKGMAAVTGNIGIIYDEEGNTSRALEYYFEALKLNEQSGNEDGQAANLSNIGIVYYEQNDLTTALKYYEKALALNQKVGNKLNEANTLNSMGNLFSRMRSFPKALQFFLQAEKLYTEAGSMQGLPHVYTNLGTIYSERGDSCEKKGNRSCAVMNYMTAKRYHERSQALNEEMGEKHLLCMNYANIGLIMSSLGQHKKAEELFKKTIELALTIHQAEALKEANSYLYEMYRAMGKYELALKHFELFIAYRDSLHNEETNRAGVRAQLKYDYEKQAAADSVAFAKERDVKSAEFSRQSAELRARKNQQYALFGGLFLVLLFSVFMFNRFKVTQKQKGIIELQKQEVEAQKHLVEEKQKEIVDSIHYARRIQLAQIPSENQVFKMLVKLMG